MSGALRQFSARKPAAPSGFDIYSLPWSSIHWAEDPNWTPPSDGAAVVSWRDGGSNGSDLTSPSAGNRPTYRATGLNGRPSLDFTDTGSSATSSYIENSSMAGPTAAPWTRLIVWRSDVTNTEYLLDSAGVTGERAFMLWNGGTGDFTAGGGGVNVTVSYAHNLKRALWLVQLDASGNVSIERNGTVLGAGSGAATSTGFDSMRIGASRGATTPADGDLALHGILPRLLTSQEKDDLLAWADDLYALEA